MFKKSIKSVLSIASVLSVILLTGCNTTANLAKGVKGKAIAASGNVFIAEVTPKDALSNAPTGKVVIANIEYTATPLGKESKSYGYKKIVKTPVVFGLFGGSTTTTIIVTGNNLKEINAMAKALNPLQPKPKKQE
jgi:predicted small secreted protein